MISNVPDAIYTSEDGRPLSDRSRDVSSCSSDQNKSYVYPADTLSVRCTYHIFEVRFSVNTQLGRSSRISREDIKTYRCGKGLDISRRRIVYDIIRRRGEVLLRRPAAARNDRGFQESRRAAGRRLGATQGQQHVTKPQFGCFDVESRLSPTPFKIYGTSRDPQLYLINRTPIQRSWRCLHAPTQPGWRPLNISICDVVFAFAGRRPNPPIDSQPI